MRRHIIIGGGIVGLLTARELVAAGDHVTLIERGQCAREASWAGGGIVSPLYPWRYAPAVTALANWGQDYYPTLVEALKAEVGIDAEFNPCGLLILDARFEGEALAWAAAFDRQVHKVDAAFMYQKVAGLAPGFAHGLWMPTVGNVRNPRLGQALRKWIAGSPHATLLENAKVQSVTHYQGRATGVKTGGGVIEADTVIIAAGAWSETLLSPLGVSLPVAPVRGQMILFKGESDSLPTIVLHEGHYAIPRRDGRVVVGSTLEHVGFDKGTTQDALELLSDWAYSTLPALKNVSVEGQWAGLRPGSPAGVPFIGAIDALEGLYINAGHFRNGLVLAPASARLMTDIVLDRKPFTDPAPYQLSLLKEAQTVNGCHIY